MSGSADEARGIDLPELLRRVRALQLPPGHWAVHGSGPLLAHALLPAVNDIDVVARGPAWRRALHLGTAERAAAGDLRVRLPGAVEVFDGWLGADPGPLIDGATLVQGVPFAPLAAVLAFKRRLGRPKDAAHVALLEAHLAARDAEPGGAPGGVTGGAPGGKTPPRERG